MPRAFAIKLSPGRHSHAGWGFYASEGAAERLSVDAFSISQFFSPSAPDICE